MQKVPDIGPFRKRLEELDALMSAPDFYGDPRGAAGLTREHQRITQVIARHQAHDAVRRQLEENEALVRDESVEPELREMAEEELAELRARCEETGAALLREMIPPDPTDSRNTVMEIRAGAGGDEAALFAGDLLRMYTRHAETRGWRVEPMSASPAEAGGFKEVITRISGEDVYKFLKFESGVHRVQRVPVTEASGRIHTSTATVAVLPEAEEVDIEIDPNDLEIQTMRASGAGGQHVNTTDSAVQIVHLPTGVTVYCADERSQLKNRTKAMTVLRSRLLRAREEEEQAKYAAHRKGQIGTGDRSERIRTYNFPQGRLTDHRIGLSLSLPSVIEGELDELIDALQTADMEARVAGLLAAQEEQTAGSG